MSCAVLVSWAFTCAGVYDGFFDLMSAHTPAAYGVAADVPLKYAS